MRDKIAAARFSEALWFKKGELDSIAAAAAAQSDGDAAIETSDSLPLDVRYIDDGSLTPADALAYGLATGRTGKMPALLARSPSPHASVSERAIVREMRGAQIWMFPALMAVVVAAAAIVANLARGS